MIQFTKIEINLDTDCSHNLYFFSQPFNPLEPLMAQTATTYTANNNPIVVVKLSEVPSNFSYVFKFSF